ncbi:DnaK suppressor protein homolog [Thiomonas delicata]|jgi:DnaK suppressor protein|uniref:DnaK suppressor protein homolog n=2 Tax=Thiomonas delicata TaxID=364030 RepID=A0A238D3G0_THIDL|nr:DnaK suppressor protein homolog [Thiomonas delicata]
MMNSQALTAAPAQRAQSLPVRALEAMSPQQLAFFRNLLETKRASLLRAAHETMNHLQEFEPTSDVSDRASLEEDHFLEFRVRDRERKHLHAIDEALARIQDGSYGICEQTGEMIGIARLLVRPTATLSIEAQEQQELTRKMQPLKHRF